MHRLVLLDEPHEHEQQCRDMCVFLHDGMLHKYVSARTNPYQESTQRTNKDDKVTHKRTPQRTQNKSEEISQGGNGTGDSRTGKARASPPNKKKGQGGGGGN